MGREETAHGSKGRKREIKESVCDGGGKGKWDGRRNRKEEETAMNQKAEENKGKLKVYVRVEDREEGRKKPEKKGEKEATWRC